MKMKIETFQACKTAYMRQTGAYGEKNHEVMEQLKNWAKSCNLLHSNAVIFGIIHDDPQTTRPDDCRYDAAIALDAGYFPEGEVKEGSISGGKYAVFTVAHTAEAVEQAWREIFSLLANSGCNIDMDRPVLERYGVKMVEQHLCEICVPIG